MNSLLENLTSVQWWLGVVVVGILINLLSVFIKNKYDNCFSKLSSWWRNRSEESKRQFEADVDLLKNNQQELLLASISEIRWINRAIYLLLTSVILFLIGFTAMYFLIQKIIVGSYLNSIIIIAIYFGATISMFSSLIFRNVADDISDKISAALKKENLGK